MKQVQPAYNPFEPLTLRLLQQLLAAGRKYWIVQRFRWPGIAPGTAFIVTPYTDKAEAGLHQAAIAAKDGKLLDMESEPQKIANLISGGSGYHVFLETFKDADWELKLKKCYGQKIMAFIRQKTNLFPKAGTVVDVHFYLKSGYLQADLDYGQKKVTAPAYDMIC